MECPILPAPDDDDDDDDDDDECDTVSGSLATETEVLREKLLCPPQIQNDLTRARTQAAEVETSD
jgi:hypothetical protein